MMAFCDDREDINSISLTGIDIFYTILTFLWQVWYSIRHPDSYYPCFVFILPFSSVVESLIQMSCLPFSCKAVNGKV
jgi:hypothetical protein